MPGRIATLSGLLAGCIALLAGSLPAAEASNLADALIVQSQTPGSLDYGIAAYDLAGQPRSSFAPQQAPASTDQWHPRDLATSPAGELHVYDGTFDPYLSTRDLGDGSWSHDTHSGWSTVNNGSYGGIARAGDRVFVTNMATSGKPSTGVVAFDVPLGTSSEFASALAPIDLSYGFDGALWVLDGSAMAHAFDPGTLASLGSVSVAAAGSAVRALAVAADGHFYAATWGGDVAHLAPDGSLVATLALGGELIDIDLSEEGLLAVGSRFDGVWLTDTALSPAEQLGSGRWYSFVAFLPEPGSGSGLALGFALLVSLRKSRQRG